jgi:hypothetical protein
MLRWAMTLRVTQTLFKMKAEACIGGAVLRAHRKVVGCGRKLNGFAMVSAASRLRLNNFPIQLSPKPTKKAP